MGKPGLIFATLFPKDIQRNEFNNIQKMLEECMGYKDKYRDITFIAGSAHLNTVQKAENTFKEFAKDACMHFVHCPFRMEDNFSEVRAHEIGFSKRFLHQFILDRKLDHFLFWIDSDMCIPWKDVDSELNKLTHSSFFTNFPYCLRKSLATPPEQLGCYLLNTAKLDTNAVAHIYETAKSKNGVIVRPGAPDCRLRSYLLKNGGKENRALEIYSEHYDEEGGLYIFNKGVCKEKKWK